ncbi:glycoside hydrolase family 43 protein [Cerasicoccus fimbriatus]|uniref:glycoside hydrolase family 43 protein n=1 Tax=Cerasicoccus fimbriatus TaxID=3014554 RepID=UPI0022B4F4FA|nr:glycoside hydrolase family 43 protein [Cerasicoccus sp. TK19100]
MDNISLSNPILSGMHPDPTICRVGNVYYLATSSFGQFPGVPLYRSSDLSNWEFVRHILSRPEQLDFVPEQRLGASGIYAPTLRYHNGKFYLISTLIGNKGHFIVSANDPEAEWSDPVWIDDDHQGGIDPSVTFLEDGTVLCQVTADGGKNEAHGIVQFEIDIETGVGLSPRQFLTSGFGWKATEGPHLFRRGSYWYLLTAEGGTEANHRVAIGRSETAWGPWEACPHNPILTHSGIESPIQNTGHGDFVEGADGKWWMVFLGVRPMGYPPVHLFGRETFLVPVEWSSDGWPIVNEGKPVALTRNPNAECRVWTDNFDSTDLMLHHRWVTIGRAYRDVFESCASGGLRLFSHSPTLAEAGIKAWLGTRMDALGSMFECQVAIDHAETEIGISAFMESHGYFSMGVSKMHDDAGVRVRFTQQVLDLNVKKEAVIEAKDTYRLRMELTSGPLGWKGAPSSLIFSIETAENEWTIIGRGQSRLLSTELIGGFGGLFTGPYCVGPRGTTGRVLSFSRIQ